jgi:Tfp pilus assembly protein PilP
MKLTTGILILGMAAAAWAQNPDEIQNARDTMRAVQQKKQNDSDAALGGAQSTANPAPQAQGSMARGAQSSPATTAGAKTVSIASGNQAAKASHGKPKTRVVAVGKSRQPKARVAVESSNPQPAANAQPRQVNLADRRDPFVSPVVNRSMVGSGCSTGKRCLAIDQINLKGVVKADSGMIAVVVNSLNKAYFLRENDPVFNGFVVKITGDSIIFKETVQDRLGKPSMREVTKKITTSAV